MDEANILKEADKLVHGDRNRDYGHPLDDFTRTAQMWSAILGVYVPPHKVGLCMMALKISRECNRHKTDNLVDAAGYAETVNMVLAEEQRRAGAAETFGPIFQVWPDTQAHRFEIGEEVELTDDAQFGGRFIGLPAVVVDKTAGALELLVKGGARIVVSPECVRHRKEDRKP